MTAVLIRLRFLSGLWTQMAIAEKVIGGGGDYLLALKGNQEALHNAAIDYKAAA